MSNKNEYMFHPGGFGESNENHDQRPAKVDPCIIRPIALPGLHPVVLDYLLDLGTATGFRVVCVAIRNARGWLCFYNLQPLDMAQ